LTSILPRTIHQSVPSEELGPASVHVKSKGFGVSVISENSLVTESMPSSADSTDIASSSTVPSTATTIASVIDAADASAVVVAVAVGSTNGLESNTSSSSSEGSIPLGPRVYPPSKPHQGSGRQAESLVKLKQELRNGVDR
jgi:hypothetical protein